jgi:hypothetical protein
MKLEFSWQIFEKYWNVTLYENPSRGSRVDPCGRTDDRQTSMTKLIVTFWKFLNAPKNACVFYLKIPYNCTENWRWYLWISITELVDFICLSVFWKNTPHRKRSLFQPEVKTVTVLLRCFPQNGKIWLIEYHLQDLRIIIIKRAIKKYDGSFGLDS